MCPNGMFDLSPYVGTLGPTYILFDHGPLGNAPQYPTKIILVYDVGQKICGLGGKCQIGLLHAEEHLTQRLRYAWAKYSGSQSRYILIAFLDILGALPESRLKF